MEIWVMLVDIPISNWINIRCYACNTWGYISLRQPIGCHHWWLQKRFIVDFFVSMMNTFDTCLFG